MRAIGMLLCALLLSGVGPASANDAAASTAMGGIRLVRESRIAMLKERLFLSFAKVRVEYEFLNESNADITTDVAFPIPKYNFDYHEPPRAFADFRVWVNGRQVPYKTDAKAELDGRDYTKYLKKLGIDPWSFGNVDRKKLRVRDLQRLSAAKLAELVSLGLLTKEDHLPQWTIQKTYHWQQTFPAKRVLRVRHEYAPVTGWQGSMSADDIDMQRLPTDQPAHTRDPDELVDWVELPEVIQNSCFTPDEKASIKTEAKALFVPDSDGDHFFHDMHMDWIDYILTTANTWKTPIGDFELIVEVSPERKSMPHVSFCWDGPIERPDARHYVARARNFVPQRELHVAAVYP